MPDVPVAQQKMSAEFARLRPGAVLTHPTTGEPIARVVDVRNSTREAAGKATRYTMIIIAEAIQDG